MCSSDLAENWVRTVPVPGTFECQCRHDCLCYFGASDKLPKFLAAFVVGVVVLALGFALWMHGCLFSAAATANTGPEDAPLANHLHNTGLV